MKHLIRIPVVIASLAAVLAACGEIISNETADTNQLTYWHEQDDFTEIKGSYLDAKLWIVRKSGEYLDLQFQCFRDSDAHYPNEFNLIVNSSIENASVNGTARYIDAVLYKRDDQAAQIFRTLDGDVISTFQKTSLNVSSVFAKDENGNLPDQVKFRFVYGVSPFEAQIGDVPKLSRAPSVDITINTSDSEVGQFLGECMPKTLQS